MCLNVSNTSHLDVNFKDLIQIKEMYLLVLDENNFD